MAVQKDLSGEAKCLAAREVRSETTPLIHEDYALVPRVTVLVSVFKRLTEVSPIQLTIT